MRRHRIVHNEIKMKDEAAPAAAGAGSEAPGGPAALLRNNLVMNALWSIVGGSRPHVSRVQWGWCCSDASHCRSLCMHVFNT